MIFLLSPPLPLGFLAEQAEFSSHESQPGSRKPLNSKPATTGVASVRLSAFVTLMHCGILGTSIITRFCVLTLSFLMRYIRFSYVVHVLLTGIFYSTKWLFLNTSKQKCCATLYAVKHRECKLVRSLVQISR